MCACVLSLFLLLADAPPTDLGGKVTGPDGQPVARATVCLFTAAPKKGNPTVNPSDYPDCAKSAVSDANGAFKIAGVDGSLNFEVLVVSDQFRPLLLKKVDPSRGALEAKLKAPPADVDPELVLKGHVVDSAGNPILGVLIEPQGYGDGNSRTFGGESSVIDPQTYTNAKGEFTLIAKKTGFDYNLLMRSPHAAAINAKRVRCGESVNEFTLPVGATITGKVVRDGQPVPGVKMQLIPANRASEDWLGIFSTIADEKGQFTFAHIPAGTGWDMSATPKSLAGRGAMTSIRCSSSADESTTELDDVVLEPGFTLVGQLVASAGSPEFEQAKIQVMNQSSWGEAIEVKPDKEGKFEVKALPSDVLRLSLNLEGFHLSEENASADPYGPRYLVGRIDEDIKDLKIQLDPGPMETKRTRDRAREQAIQSARLSGIESK